MIERNLAVALTIAGSDSGGGAGLQADLKTFAALGLHGTTAITCVTAQNSKRVLAIEPCKPSLVLKQILAVFEETPPGAVKTGMLYSAEIVRAVAGFFAALKNSPPLIVDPVLISTSGSRLLKRTAAIVLRQQLLPLATLVTPNLSEAEWLIGQQVRSPEEMRTAARLIWNKFGCPALIKGGHLKGVNQAVDIFYDGQHEFMFQAPFIKGVSLHGTGCTYSAAITAFLALGSDLPEAVRQGKGYISDTIASLAVRKYNQTPPLKINPKERRERKEKTTTAEKTK